MRGNDLSNQVQDSLLIHWGVVASATPRLRKKLLLPDLSWDLSVRMSDLSLIRSLQSKWEVLCVLFSYVSDPVDANHVQDSLHPHGSPFSSCLEFESTDSLSSYIAMRPDIRYVADNNHVGAFGSRTLYM